MLRRLLYGQLFAFLLLIVAFTVLTAGSSLARVAGDATAEAVLWWVAMAALILAAIDLVSMVITLALLGIGISPREIE